VTHLGQRLSALIDGELGPFERDQVVWHLARCAACQDEAAALRALKRRMNALGEAAADAALTGRLMGLSSIDHGRWPQVEWPRTAPSTRPEAKAGRYFLAGSFAVFLVGLGTAAFIAGGEPQAQAPTPRVTPPVGIYTVEHDDMNGLFVNVPLEPITTAPGSGEGQSSHRP